MSSDFTDDNFLHQYFHLYLDHMYGIAFYNNPKYWFMDGFEQPLDPDYLCDAVRSLADRLGYKLNDKNMWEEVLILKKQARPNIQLCKNVIDNSTKKI